ncbi:hypothetical protein DITRI_Ditri02bG0131500 [Diplodiscus trichospermus]
MSAYGHQMEREFSAQSLSSRDTGTEMGSRYVVESGFYMSSFAGTIFIAALVTVGVLLATLLVTLAVMLQSCDSRSKGVVEIEKTSDSYHYCKVFTQHGELNSLEAAEVPPINSESFMFFSVNWFCLSVSLLVKKFAGYVQFWIKILFWLRLNQYVCGKPIDCIEDATYLKHLLTLELYRKLQSGGWPLILFTRKPERQRNVTVKHLNSLGYSRWLDSEMEMDTREYFSRQREAMKKQDTQIISVISSQMDALTGPFLGRRVFKLPNPSYYNFEYHIESWRLSH